MPGMLPRDSIYLPYIFESESSYRLTVYRGGREEAGIKNRGGYLERTDRIEEGSKLILG